MYNALGSHFTKNPPVLPFLGTHKMENPFLYGNSKKPSYKSCRHRKDAHLCQKQGQYLKVFYEACINQAHLGRKPSKVLFGAIFVKSFSIKHWYAMFGIFP
jgi:hypothetical protein